MPATLKSMSIASSAGLLDTPLPLAQALGSGGGRTRETGAATSADDPLSVLRLLDDSAGVVGFQSPGLVRTRRLVLQPID